MANKKSKDKSSVKSKKVKKNIIDDKTISPMKTETKGIIKSFENIIFPNQNALMKLRIAIVIIFLLSTISIFIVVADFVISAILILISYFLLFVLMIKLLIIKKL